MTTPFSLRLVSTTLAAVMSISMVACSKTDSATDAPAPNITVGTEIDDSVITTRVKSALLDNVDIKSFDLKVETRKGEVMLTGFVDNPSQIDRALAITQGISGVKSVDNKINLKGSSTSIGNKIDDGVITAKVKAALLADTSVKSVDIAVITRKGEVHLSGFVNNQGQMERAQEVARVVEGVNSVNNDMKIKQ